MSLVPSLTELVCDLGLSGSLVGRTGFCVHPRETLRRIPKVGGTKDVRIDAVRSLAPTHLVVNIDENRRQDVEEMARFVPHVIVTHPLAPEDNPPLYRLFGHVFDRRAEARALAARFRRALRALRGVAAGLPREHVLYLIWRKPWMTVSRSTYISATLAAAGWDTLPGASAERYPALSLGEDWLGEVDRILLPSEPYAFRPRHREELAGVPALLQCPIQPIDGEMTSWYGSRAIAGLRWLAALRLRLSREA